MSAIFHVRVNEETSPLIQEMLFEKGYSWRRTDKTVQHIEEPYLYPWDDYSLCYGHSKDRKFHF